MMGAVLLDRPGAWRALRPATCPLPFPGPGEVLLRVEACGVGMTDLLARQGRLAPRFPQALPAIPGWPVAGSVAATGPGAGRFREGDAVFGVLEAARGGGYAQYVATAEDRLLPLPAGLAMAQAAGLVGPLALAAAAMACLEGLPGGTGVLVLDGDGDAGRLVRQLLRGRPDLAVAASGKREVPGQAAPPGRWLPARAARAAAGTADAILDLSAAPPWPLVGRAAARGALVVAHDPAGVAPPGAIGLAWPMVTPEVGLLAARAAAGELVPPPVEPVSLELAPEVHALGDLGRWSGMPVLIPWPRAKAGRVPP